MPEYPLKILVVEDEAVVLHTLKLILKHGGFDARGAEHGSEALALAAEFRPDVLLCDINLPDINGIQVALQVKNNLPECRVILLSGEISSTELLQEAESQGYHFEVLAKPAEPQMLLRMLAARDGTRQDPSGIHRVK